MADRRDEERRGDPVLVQQPQNPRQAVDRAVLAARDRFRDQVAGRQIRRRVVDVEAQADRDARAVPAYLNLGDVRVAQGNERDAAVVWERLIDVAPDRAYLAFDRLARRLARRRPGEPIDEAALAEAG